MTRRAAATAATLLALLAAGCSGAPADEPDDSGSAPVPVPASSISDAEHAALVDAAGLDLCPATASAPVSGSELPDLTLPCLGDGPDVNLSALGGKPYLVVVWGAWCVPCAEEMPYLQAVYEDAGGPDAPVGFLGIDINDPHGKGLAWAAATGITFPSLEDEDTRSRPGLRYQAPPWSFLVTADGEVAGEHIGAFTSADDVRREIESSLGIVL